MSTIVSGYSAPLSIPLNGPAPAAAVSTTETAAPSQAYKPQWLVPLAGGGTSFEMLGLVMPKASGDLAALIAEVSLGLEKSVDDGRKQSAFAKLAALASGLTRFDNTALKIDAEQKTATRTRTSETKTESDAAARILLKDRTAAGTDPERLSAVDIRIQEARIESYGKEIDNLRADLSTAEPGSAKAAELERAISTKQAQINGVAVSLQASKQDIADAKADIATYQARIDLEMAKPEEERDQTVIDVAMASLTESKTELDQAYADLGRAATRGLTADGRSLAGTLGQQEAAANTASSLYTTASVIALAMATVFSAAYQSSSAAAEQEGAGRDIGIDVEFEDIASELKTVSARKLLMDAEVSKALETLTEDKRERIETIAFGLLSSIATVLSALSQSGDLAVPAAAPAAVGSRFRIDA